LEPARGEPTRSAGCGDEERPNAPEAGENLGFASGVAISVIPAQDGRRNPHTGGIISEEREAYKIEGRER